MNNLCEFTMFKVYELSFKHLIVLSSRSRCQRDLHNQFTFYVKHVAECATLAMYKTVQTSKCNYKNVQILQCIARICKSRSGDFGQVCVVCCLKEPL